MNDWDETLAAALRLPDTFVEPYYGRPTAKIAPNGRPFLSPGREADSFCLHLDPDTIEMLKETDPATYHQTPHYEGWGAVLVRYGSDDPQRVLAMIELAHDQAAAKPKAKARKKA
ncbi:MAG: hypothetical protein K2W81_07670 [Sphingomonas sp.]|uniref:hypothetical protein n=1 Tax=Sphingomonas sp. TaxID=28214 RepID=UPI0025E025B8|nr:hypothetical protein [Sphingomonas sp.]MBY0283827.1 hypothetical protein [Sphingomonas sp.]